MSQSSGRTKGAAEEESCHGEEERRKQEAEYGVQVTGYSKQGTGDREANLLLCFVQGFALEG
ncbi:MAG TPA: hypothetical protein VJZ02_00525 [Candidatus Brocadiales bacterium]|nr:hypothetical protein [Candidatus Brocadiales bacterium]